MSIAKVEPLTTARALRGPFDYLLPERLGEVGVGTVLVVPFGRRRLLGVVVELAERSALPPERLAEPIAALEAGVPPELVELGLWVAREYCSTPARGLELVLPPGTGSAPRSDRRRGPRPPRAATAAARAVEPGGLGPGQRRALELLAASAEASSAPASSPPPGVGRDALRRLERRGLVELGRARGAPAPGAAPRSARRPRRGRARPRPARARSSGSSAALDGGGGGAAPARGHRLGQDRGLPRRRRGGARARPRRDRARARDRDDAAGAGALRRPLRRPGRGAALAARRRRAPRRVAPAARRRGADLRRPALGGLRPDRRPRA